MLFRSEPGLGTAIFDSLSVAWTREARADGGLRVRLEVPAAARRG